MFRHGKYLFSRIHLNEFTKVKIGCAVRNSRGLLHIMCHNRNRKILAKFFN